MLSRIKAYVKRLLLLTFLITIFIILSALGSSAAVKSITVKDDVGREVKLSRPAVRIVALSNAHAENLVAMRAVRQLAGVSKLADPKWIPTSVPRLSLNPGPDQVIKLKPDLVLLEKSRAASHRELIEGLLTEGIPYAILDVPQLAEFETYMQKLAQLSGREKDAARANKTFERAMLKSDIRPVGAIKPRVLVVAGADYSVSAPGSWAAGIVKASGGRLFLDRGGVPINHFPWYVFFGPKRLKSSGEGIDVIITLSGTGRSFPSLSREDIMKNPEFQNLPAVKSGRVWEMRANDITLPSMLRLDNSLKQCWELIYAEGRPLEEDGKK